MRHRQPFPSLDSWIFDALTEELTEDHDAGGSGINLVTDRLFREGAEPLVVSTLPPPPVSARAPEGALRPTPVHCDVAELSRLLEGDELTGTAYAKVWRQS